MCIKPHLRSKDAEIGVVISRSLTAFSTTFLLKFPPSVADPLNKGSKIRKRHGGQNENRHESFTLNHIDLRPQR